MSCLDNIVAIKGCGEAGAGAWVNHLPGLSVMDFEKAISNEHKSGFARLQELIAQGTEEVVADIRTALGASFSLRSIVDSDSIGHIAENKTAVDAVANYRTGVQVKIQGEPYLAFHISNLRLFVDETGDVEVKVWDVLTGVVLDTFTVAAEAGELVTLVVNKTYHTAGNRMNLFIGYESDFDSYRTELHANGCNCYGGSGYSNELIYFRGAKVATASAVVNQNVEAQTYTGGIGFDYSLQCSFDEHFCNIRNLITQPVLYKVGSLIAREMRFSKRLTGVVTNFRDDHAELEKEYEMIYRDKIGAVMKNQTLKDSACFGCNSRMKGEVMLP